MHSASGHSDTLNLKILDMILIQDGYAHMQGHHLFFLASPKLTSILFIPVQPFPVLNYYQSRGQRPNTHIDVLHSPPCRGLGGAGNYDSELLNNPLTQSMQRNNSLYACFI